MCLPFWKKIAVISWNERKNSVPSAKSISIGFSLSTFHITLFIYYYWWCCCYFSCSSFVFYLCCAFVVWLFMFVCISILTEPYASQQRHRKQVKPPTMFKYQWKVQVDVNRRIYSISNAMSTQTEHTHIITILFTNLIVLCCSHKCTGVCAYE